MVSILPQFDPYGDIGRSLGQGLGQGAEDVNKRYMLQKGIGSLQQHLQGLSESGQTISPLDVQLNLVKTLGAIPGGLQAISELAPSIHKSVLTQNLMRRPTGQGQPEQQPYAGPNTEGQQRSQVPALAADPVEKTYEEYYQEELARTLDPEASAAFAKSKISARGELESQRQARTTFANNFLKSKVADTFREGLDAPLQNALERDFNNNYVSGQDANATFAKLLPKYRSAQANIERMSTSEGGRSSLMTGPYHTRWRNAQSILAPIADIDEEYAVGLAESKLNYGPTEAASLIRPGDKKYGQFISQIIKPKVKRDVFGGEILKKHQEPRYISEDRYIKETKKNLVKYLKSGWDTNKNSLQALRGDLYDKGISDDIFRQAVIEAFPGGINDPSLSQFNRNEIPKLSEAVVPGLGEIFQDILQRSFEKLYKTAKYPITGRR